MFNLTDSQKEVIKWIVQQVQDGKLADEFVIHTWSDNSSVIYDNDDRHPEKSPRITQGTIAALCDAQLFLHINGDEYALTQRAFEAVSTNFDAPDLSFVKYLSPLADVTNLDAEIKRRCLPILRANGNDPLLWDSVMRTAGVILEERLREVGHISDHNLNGSKLVNEVFGQNGSLASKFTIESERIGHRDLYAGIVGAFRNPSAHRLVDPNPEDGGAFIVFVDLLLRKLDQLR